MAVTSPGAEEALRDAKFWELVPTELARSLAPMRLSAANRIWRRSHTRSGVLSAEEEEGALSRFTEGRKK